MNAPDAPAAAAAPSRTGRWEPLRWLNLIWLVNLAFQPIYDPGATALDWLLVAAVIGVVVALYAVTDLRPERARRWFTVPVTLLGLAVTPLNAGGAVLFVYAAASAGASESRRTALRWMVGLTVLWGVYGTVLFALTRIVMPWGLWAFLPPLLFIWVIGLWVIESAEQEQAAAELRIRNAHVGHLATMAERERIARDLHDLLGHSLTSLVVRAQLVQELTGADPARAHKEAAEIEHTAREALAEVRNAVTGWRQASLDAELEAARQTLAAAGVEFTVRRAEDLQLVGAAERELALALREAVTNVTRHAHARTCRVDLGAHGDELRLVVADDGVGGNARDGAGLTGMRERIAALGGRVARVGAPGTTVTVVVPLRVAT